MRKLSIITPAYNEEKSVEGFVSKAQEVMGKVGVPSELIIVDDNSVDGTADILNVLAEKGAVKTFRHEENLGYGASLKTGISRADGDVICIIDSDSTYRPEDIEKLLPFIEYYDMVVGARQYAPPLHQKVAKGAVSLLLKVLFGQGVLDLNSGLRLFKKSVLERYVSYLPDAFSFTSTITLIMLLKRHKIKYESVSYLKRVGRSKVRVPSYTVNFLKSYWRICRLHWQRRLV